MEDTEKNQEVQEDPSPKGLGGAPRLDDGGPAFPLPDWANIPWPAGTPSDFGMGLSLRDYFAAKALQGILTHGGSYGHIDGKGDDTRLAALAWAYADAMLKARKAGAA